MKRKNYLLLILLATITTSCSSYHVSTHDEWAKFFQENKVKGCFMLYDNGHSHIDVYNLPRTQQRFLPASTFKIMNALVGLETGVISDTNMVIKWDSVKRWNNAWNRDLTMGEAFRLSAVPYYQQVARGIGRTVMQFWIDSVKYGNMQMSSRIDSFWLDNSLKISPDEQLGLVKQLYFSKLPFHERPQRLVRNVMLMENTSKYKLSYKTGWGFANGHAIGWMVGWEEENNHPYFFVLNIESADTAADIAAIRRNIFRGIMQQEGFFKGNK